MGKFSRKILSHPKYFLALALIFLMSGVLGIAQFVKASATSNFTQTISAGTLSVDIVDGSYVTVGSPSVAMTTKTFSFACQTSTGLLGTTTQRIYVQNPDAADNGWVVNLAATNPTDVWDSAGTDFDFNDPGSSGCIDDGATTDADSLGGQMTVNPSVGSIATGSCLTCSTSNVTLGSSDSFVETSKNSILIVQGASGSSDIGDWLVTDVSVSQKIPAEQPAAADYDINMMLTVGTS